MATPEVTIPITAKFKPSGLGGFALMDTVDITHNGIPLSDLMYVKLTQEEYNALVAEGKMNPNTPYMIQEGEDE